MSVDQQQQRHQHPLPPPPGPNHTPVPTTSSSSTTVLPPISPSGKNHAVLQPHTQQFTPSHTPLPPLQQNGYTSQEEGTIEKKRPATMTTEASLLPVDDRNEWYYPSAPRPSRIVDDEEEDILPIGTSMGNWGNKLIKGARWVRHGKAVEWGSGRIEWEMEERARKRLKRFMPNQEPPSSPPLPTLPHLRSPTPPLIAPYSVPIDTHHSFTSFVLDPSVQHTYRSSNIRELERTATELIEGEGALRMAIGALWRAMEGDRGLGAYEVERTGRSPSDRDSNGDMDVDLRKDDENASSTRASSLFISPHLIPVGPEGAVMLPPKSQMESFEWSLNVLRELADDSREYMERLEDIRDGLGVSRAMRKEVWTIAREQAVEEMDAEDEEQESDWE
ncbi:hypothetical protein FRC02_008251 [Tulasnella sp. 418]|nr:hypothetical protein FRC02_008251 [Tulasnella sp. 418]